MKWTRTSLQVEFTSRVYRIFTSLRKLSSLITLTLYEIVTIIQRQVDVIVGGFFFFFFGIVSANVNNQLCSVSVKDKPEPRDVLETHSFWNLQVKLQWVST